MSQIRAAKPDGLSLIPETQVVRGEDQLLPVVSDLWICTVACVYTYICIYTKIIK